MRDVVPIIGHPDEPQRSVVLEVPGTGARRFQKPLDGVHRLLHDQLCPHIDGCEFAPALVDLVDVHLVVDVHELEEVEQEQRDVGVGPGGHVGDRRRPRDPRVELPEVDLIGVDVDEHIDLEEALVALLPQPVSEPADMLDRDGPVRLAERLREQVVTAPSPLVRSELGIAGQIGHERPHDGAVAGVDGLHGRGPVVDPLHDLELFADHVLGVALPVALLLDEEGRLARIAVRRLHDQVGAQSRVGGELGQLVVAVGPSDDVGHRGCPRLFAEASRHDLGVQVPSQRVRREDQVVAQLLADLLGLLVEEHHRDHRRHARGSHPRRDVGLHLGIPQEVVVDLLAALELDERLVLRGEDPRVGAVPGVVVDEVAEVTDPAVDAEQVERGRSHEEDRASVGPEEAADLRDRPQRSAYIRKLFSWRRSRPPPSGIVA